MAQGLKPWEDLDTFLCLRLKLKSESAVSLHFHLEVMKSSDLLCSHQLVGSPPGVSLYGGLRSFHVLIILGKFFLHHKLFLKLKEMATSLRLKNTQVKEKYIGPFKI